MKNRFTTLIHKYYSKYFGKRSRLLSRIYLGLMLAASSAAHPVKAQKIKLEQLDLSNTALAEWYDANAEKNNPILLQGKIANMERKSLYSHAYLGKFEWLRGDVTYRRHHFQAVPLLYDLEKDVLLALRSGENTYEMFIELKSDLVTDFKIEDSRFIRMTAEAPDKPGFYQVLFEGKKLKFYARRKKKLEISSLQGFLFVQSDDYYLQYKGEFYPIRNVGSLARLFKENRKLIKSFARKTYLRELNNETDKQFTILVAYCDSLNL